MYSFYGGRPGNSFVIITTFKSVNDMINAFKKGPEYKTVHYDEYVMINTDNKNNLENGRLYRRGYQFTNSMGGAEYIGTIAGPSGNAPQLTIETINEVKTKNVPDGYSGKSQNGEYSVSNDALVPGKTKDINGDDVYNDTIKWASCSIVNENNEEATAYLGFTFPYPVIEFLTESVEPYLGGSYADTLSISRDDEMDHPFYERWNIRIPKGIKGDTFKNFRVITASNEDGVQQYDGQPDDRSGSREILVYDYYNYDKKENGDPKTLYLGDYNMIEGISVLDDGTLTVNYTHDTNYIKTKLFKWINSITLTADGTFTVTYNYDSDAQGNPTTYSTRLDWIKNISISDEGIITLTHNNNDTDTLDTTVKWCSGVHLTPDGILTFSWNDGSRPTSLDTKIQWITAIELSAEGIFKIIYNTPDENNPSQNKQQVFSNKIKWIKSADLNNGTLTITYNTPALDEHGNAILDQNNEVTYEKDVFDNAFRYISSINHSYRQQEQDEGHRGVLYINYNDNTTDEIDLDLLTDVSMEQATGKVYVEWNEDIPQLLGTVNFISNLTIDSSGNLLVYYSDPTKRGQITVNNESGWTLLGKVAPYGNNVDMTVSRIVRGKYFIEDNQAYLEFYIENIGLLRVTDVATITSGTATMYHNNQQVGSEISLTNMRFQALDEQTDTLNTLNFKIELDNSYSITNPPQLVDVELKNVIFSVTRNDTANIISNVKDQQRQIDQNAQNIINLQSYTTSLEDDINTIEDRLNNFENNTTLDTITLNNSLKVKELTRNTYVQQPIMIKSGTKTIGVNEAPSIKRVELTKIEAPYNSGYKIIPFVSRKFRSTSNTEVPDDYGDFYYGYYNPDKSTVYIKTAKVLSKSAIYQYDWMIYAVPE